MKANNTTRVTVLTSAVVVCALIVAILQFRDLKKGLDLAGGHELIFKIDMEGISDTGAVQERMIEILKQRVDKLGLLNLEWRPMGRDRILVRMPVGSSESSVKKAKYVRALEQLDVWNLSPADYREVFDSSGAERTKLIAEKSKGDKARNNSLTRSAELSDTRRQTRRQLAELPSASTRPTAQPTEAETQLEERRESIQDDYDDATAEYYGTLDSLAATNLNTQELDNVFDLYVSPRLAKEMLTGDVENRTKELDEKLAQHEEKYPQLANDIDAAFATYKEWTRVRGRLDDPQDLIRIVSRVGLLEFRIAPRLETEQNTEGALLSRDQARTYVQELKEKGSKYGRDRGESYQWFLVRGGNKEAATMVQVHLIVSEYLGKPYVLLSNRAGDTMLRGKDYPKWGLKGASPDVDKNAAPAVQFTFDSDGARLFGDLTGDNIGNHLTILLDNEAFSSPVINERINQAGTITGQFTSDEVDDLVRILNSGSLPARLDPNPVSVNSIGPILGEVNIRRGTRAAYIGMIAVLAFMLLYYLLAGAIANFALAANIVLVLGCMLVFDATLTLAGIAGIILTIGIAVDANVLIFERLREEQAKAQTLRMAVRNAYGRAFSAIIDGNITTLLICVILGWFGTQDVRGFAITLGMGIAISLFTALVLTRYIFDLLISAGILKNRIHMMRLFGTPKINWIGKRYAFWLVSGAVIVIGVTALISQGSRVLGIELRSGSRSVVRFRPDALIDGKLLTDQLVEERIKVTAEKMIVKSMAGQNIQVNVLREDNMVRDFIAEYDSTEAGGNDDDKVSLTEWVAKKRDPAVFKMYDINGDEKLESDELSTRLPGFRYVITTTESNPQEARRVIDEAFAGLMDVQTALKPEDWTLLTGTTIPEMDVRADIDGYAQILDGQDSLPAGMGGKFRQTLDDYQGGVIIAFRVADDKAMTCDAVADRLSRARLQAGRESIQLAQTTVLGLTAATGDEGKFTTFALLSRNASVSPSDANAWRTFAAGEKELLSDAMESQQSLESQSTFDPAMGQEASQRAILAIIVSWAAIIVYLWFRFGSARWGLAAVICLIHDTVVVVGLVGASIWLSRTALGSWLMIDNFKIDLPMIAAILAIIGYSVNDTIVVFDRIRENRGRRTSIDPHIINASINQTLARTVLTSGTTLIVVLVMYIFGGDGIHGFNYALLAGILFGTYSSIAIASPLLLGFKKALVVKVVMPTEPEPVAK